MKPLDYEVLENDDEWQVWTPDRNGACIGSGASCLAALCDAHANLGATAEAILKEVHEKSA